MLQYKEQYLAYGNDFRKFLYIFQARNLDPIITWVFCFMRSSTRRLFSPQGKTVCSFGIHSFPFRLLFHVTNALRAPREVLPLPSSFSKIQRFIWSIFANSFMEMIRQCSTKVIFLRVYKHALCQLNPLFIFWLVSPLC